MVLTYYDEHRKVDTRFATGLMVWNALLALAMAFYWSGLVGFMGEPYRWAMRQGVSINPSLLEYPYLMLWLTPLLCAGGTWLALKGERGTVAKIFGLYPSLMLGLMIGWYYFTPPHWR